MPKCLSTSFVCRPSGKVREEKRSSSSQRSPRFTPQYFMQSRSSRRYQTFRALFESLFCLLWKFGEMSHTNELDEYGNSQRESLMTNSGGEEFSADSLAPSCVFWWAWVVFLDTLCHRQISQYVKTSEQSQSGMSKLHVRDKNSTMETL